MFGSEATPRGHSSAIHYALQLNIYARLLEQNYGMRIGSMWLGVLHPGRGPPPPASGIRRGRRKEGGRGEAPRGGPGEGAGHGGPAPLPGGGLPAPEQCSAPAPPEHRPGLVRTPAAGGERRPDGRAVPGPRRPPRPQRWGSGGGGSVGWLVGWLVRSPHLQVPSAPMGSGIWSSRSGAGRIFFKETPVFFPTGCRLFFKMFPGMEQIPNFYGGPNQPFPLLANTINLRLARLGGHSFLAVLFFAITKCRFLKLPFYSIFYLK